MTDQTPPEKPTSAFEALLADPNEQFDKRSEILASIDAYSKAVPSTASAQTPQPYKAVLYTASEVKVLTETASEAGRRIGRKEALDEFRKEWPVAAAEVERSLRASSQAPQAASDATSGVPGHLEVSEAVRSPQEPCGHPTCPCHQEDPS